MPEIPDVSKPPQISEMFQKFALSFKSKAFEFFSDESSPKFSLLEQDHHHQQHQHEHHHHHHHHQEQQQQHHQEEEKEEKNDGKIRRNPDAQFNETLITSLFATISSFEASYLHLQTAHVPNFDEDGIKLADRSLVSHLQTLSEFKQLYRNYYDNPNFNVEFSSGSCLEFQVNENQHKLRALKSVFNRLQADIDVKDEEVSGFRKKLEEVKKCNVKLSRRLGKDGSGDEVLLTVRVFDKMLQEVFSVSHRFTKVLVDLMKKARWDLDLAANSVYSGVEYVKKGHNRYALLSYVCLRMFLGFDEEDFGAGEEGVVVSNGHVSESKGVENVYLTKLKDHISSNPMDILRKNPNCEFSRFCERKYQQLVHPTIESSIFQDLDQSGAVVDSWRSLGVFYELFVKMASSVWALHKLAFSFNPSVDIFQVERGVDFSMVYMEDVTRKCKFPCKTRPKVAFTVVPGFKIGQTVIQSQVYLNRHETC